jgi:hypothetical protein
LLVSQLPYQLLVSNGLALVVVPKLIMGIFDLLHLAEQLDE